jgi:hypothetical protein
MTCRLRRVPGFGVAGIAAQFLCGTALAQSCLWSGGDGTEIPTARVDVGMAYDAAQGRTLLYGGQSHTTGQVYGDTWEWDGSAWTLLAVSGPPADSNYVMAFDAARSRMVLFRPYNAVQSWEWDGQAWTLANSGSPPGGGWFRLFYDSFYHTVSMLQIVSSSSRLWDWNGTVWTQRATGTGLSTTNVPAAAFDSSRNRIVVFLAGYNSPGQTWEFDDVLGTWSMIPAYSPSARQSALAVYDSVSARTVLFGGYTSGPYPDYLHNVRETWEWNGSTWTETSNAGPGPFGGIAASFDSARARIVLFGGQGYDYGPNQTWEYNAAATNPGVIITQQPARILLQPGDTGSFHITATGSGPLGYQWRRDGQALGDGGNVSGSQTPDLTIGPVAGTDTGTIDCVLTDVCGPWISNPGSLTVQVPCYPNCDNSTIPPILNPNDFQCFLNVFAAGCFGPPQDCYVNCDQSTTPPYLNANDFQCFLNAFAAGCT